MSVFVQVEIAFAATLVAMLFAIPLAFWSLDRRWGGMKALNALLIFPVAISPAILGMLFFRSFRAGFPLVVDHAAFARREVFYYLAIVEGFPWTAGLLVGGVVAFPLVFLAAKRAFEQVDTSLVDSMRVFGFSGFLLFWKILLPLAWRGILAGAILGFVRALGEFAACRTFDLTGEIALSGLFIALALLVTRLPACSK